MATWTGQSFTLNQILTSTQMNQLQADITALAEGASGAPDIETAALDQAGGSEAVTQACVRDSAIGQDQLKTSSEEDSATSATHFLTSAGSYGFAFESKATYSASNTIFSNLGLEAYAATIGTYGNYIWLSTLGSPSISYAQTTYVTASPPYDMGDGEIPLFMWLLLNGNDIEAIQASITPPWAYNGPTNIKPDRVERNKQTGVVRKYKNVKSIDEESGEIIISGEIEIDAAFKNSDMNLIPHPFVGNDLTGKQIILLDPVDTLYLAELKEMGESINEILHLDYLRLDNDPINRAVPNGVTPSKFKWKNTQSKAGEMKKDRRLGRGPFASNPNP